MNHILHRIEENVWNSSSTTTISARVTLLQAVQFMADSWQEVSIATIQNCFAHCGFSIGQQINLLSRIMDEDANYLLQQVKNQEEFLLIDENVECFNED